MDFPSDHFHKPVICSMSAEAVGINFGNETAAITGAGGFTAWPVANMAFFVPFVIMAPYLVRTLWWHNGASVTGNVDCGVYTAGGTLLLSAGSTAQSGISQPQKVALGTPFLLGPGSYYMALAASSASALIARAAPPALSGQMMGLAQQASALPLPATATPASISNTCLPIFGIARATVI